MLTDPVIDGNERLERKCHKVRDNEIVDIPSKTSCK
jgi:hypothetical protein